MPNWCSNSLRINHPEKDKAEALLRAIKAGQFCHFFLPEPTGEEGYDWYTWRIANWGTKWEPCDFHFPVSDENGEVELSENEGRWETVVRFESAWSPPIETYRAATQAGYGVEAFWIEEGCAFAGLYRPEYEADPDDEEDGGETEADYEVPSRDDPEEWKHFLKEIPKALVEAFSLDNWDYGPWVSDIEGDAEEEEIKAAQITQ